MGVAPRNDYVADPQVGSGSFHSWGVAVDATLVDDWGQATLDADLFRRFYTGIDVPLHWPRSARRAHTLSSAKNDDECRLLMDCEPNGGISLPATGSVTCRNGSRNLAMPSSFPQFTNDRTFFTPSSGNRNTFTSSSSPSRLRLGDGLDRIGQSDSFCGVGRAQFATLVLDTDQRRLGLAGVPIRRARLRSRSLDELMKTGTPGSTNTSIAANNSFISFTHWRDSARVAIAVPIKWPKTSALAR